MRPPLFILCFYRTGTSPAHPPAAGAKGEANSADACPGCGDATTAPKAVRSSFKRVNLVRLRRGGVPTLGLCFVLPKNPGPGVTGAHFPFYACFRRSIDAAVFAPKKQQIPHQRDGGWYHYPRSEPRAPKTLRGHGSGGHTLPFYALCSPAAGVNAAPSFSALACARCRSMACPAFSIWRS